MLSACATGSTLACPVLQHLSTLFHKGYDLRKKLLNTKCVFWLALHLSSKTYLIFRRTERVKTINGNWSSCQVPVILVTLQWNFNFLQKFFEKYSNIKFHENPASGSRNVPCWWTETDRQTDMTKPIVAFPTIENAPKNSTFCPDRICVFCIYLGTNSDFWRT